MDIIVHRWSNNKIIKTYNFKTDDDKYIPIFADDSIEKGITKISLLIKSLDDNPTDISYIPYVWADKKSLRNTFNVIYPINPWKYKDKDLYKNVAIKYNDDNSFLENEINILFYNDATEEIRKAPFYFPDTSIIWKPENTLENLKIEATKLLEIWNLSGQKDTNFILTKIEYISENKPNKIILEDIFNNTNTSKNVPFIQLCKDIHKIKYKIYKDHNIPSNLFQLWTLYEKLPKVPMIVIMIPINIKDNVYAKCCIDENEIIFIQYVIDSKDKVDWEQMSKHINVVNRWLEQVLKKPIKIKCDSLSIKTDIINQSVTFRQLEKYISVIHPLYHLIRSSDNLLIVAFKRSEKYKKKLDISEHIKNALNHGIPIDEIMETLVEYGLTKDDIEYWKEQFKMEMEQEVDEVKKRKSLFGTGCIIKISKIPSGFRINLENAATKKEAERILRWINSTLKIKPKTKLKKIKQPSPPIEPVPPPKASSPKSSSSKEVNEDELLLFKEIGEIDLDLENLSGGAIGKKYQRLFITMLQNADPKIFSEAEDNYATKCQVNQYRQPVVINKQEKEKLEKDGYGNYDDIMLYGSDPNNKNYYFCPKIWCPISKIPLTPQQLEANNNKCPKTEANEFQDEEAIILYNHSYWDKDANKKHHIGFHSDDLNKNGMCLPCCFKKPLKDKDKFRCNLDKEPEKTKKQQDETQKKEAEEAEESQKQEDKSVKEESQKQELDNPKETYIMGAPAPIPEGRYGSIPRDLHNILTPSIGHHVCSNTNLSSQPCLVRKGIKHNQDSLLEAISVCLKLKNKKELIKLIKSSIDPIKYIALENGNLYQVFSDDTAPIPDNNKNLMKDCNKWINNKLFKNDARNLSIYKSYLNFIDYLSSNDPKNIHHIIAILELLGYILIITHKYGHNEMTFQCSAYSRGTGSKIIFLFEDTDSKLYEPLEMKKRNTEGETIFKLSDYPYVNKLLNKCNNVKYNFLNTLDVIKEWCNLLLKDGSGFYPDSIIIRQDLNIYGFLTRKNILVTVPSGMYGIDELLENTLKYNIMFLEDIQAEKKEIKNIYNDDLEIFIKKLENLGFGINTGEKISDNDLLYKGILQIPTINDNIQPIILQHSLTELDDFIKKEDNRSKKWYQIQHAIGKTLLMYYETLVEPLVKSKSRKDTIKILMNTFPKNDKNIVQTTLEEIPLYDGKEAISKWISLIGIEKNANSYYNDIVINHNKEWIFTQSRIDNGIPLYILNPSKYFKPNEKINNDTVEIVKIFEKEQKATIPLILKNVEMKSLPTKWSDSWKIMNINVNPNYSFYMIPTLVEWLSSKFNRPIEWNEIRYASISILNNSLLNKETMIMAFEDPSLYNLYETHYRKFKDAEVLWNKVLKTQTYNDRTSILNKIVSESELWPMDIDIYNISKLLNINILMIHRKKTSKDEDVKKRGDLEDQFVSSSLTLAPNNWKDQVLLIIYKDKVIDNHNVYYMVTSDNILLFEMRTLPEDIKELIRFHIKNKKDNEEN
jgi:hypothetical protein